MRRETTLIAVVLLIACTTGRAWCEETPTGPVRQSPDPHVYVNVRDFSQAAHEDDWSPAIRAAIDYVSQDNGFEAGGTVLFPAGTYPIGRPIVIGEKPAHWGLRLLGYGATLIGTAKLDEQPLPDPEPEAADKGVPMLVLKSPEGIEGAGYVIEGLRLTRQRKRGAVATGVGVSIPYAFPCGKPGPSNLMRAQTSNCLSGRSASDTSSTGNWMIQLQKKYGRSCQSPS